MSIDQIVNYWKDKICVGSVWRTQEYNKSYVTVVDIFYSKEYNSVMVHYKRTGFTAAIETIDVREFVEYIAFTRES